MAILFCISSPDILPAILQINMTDENAVVTFYRWVGAFFILSNYPADILDVLRWSSFADSIGLDEELTVDALIEIK